MAIKCKVQTTVYKLLKKRMGRCSYSHNLIAMEQNYTKQE